MTEHLDRDHRVQRSRARGHTYQWEVPVVNVRAQSLNEGATVFRMNRRWEVVGCKREVRSSGSAQMIVTLRSGAGIVKRVAVPPGHLFAVVQVDIEPPAV